MTAQNTLASYGSVAKTLHWLTALLIISLFPLGFVANEWPQDLPEEIAVKATLFSIHKTLGVAVFFVALIRIVWTVSQIKPLLLNAEHRLEAFLAEAMHSLLYLSLVLVPLSGWIGHAATTGFAPIFWPFGQSLPFVPKSPELAAFFETTHEVLVKVLLAALALHTLGALKHAIIDRDGTLARMWFGGRAVPQPPEVPHSRTPKLAALGVYGLALAAAAAIGLAETREERGEVATLAAVQSDWNVVEGELRFTVAQMGQQVEGSFAEWTAAIRFSETPVEGRHGDVEVTIAMGSVTLGSVTNEVKGSDYFNVEAFPTATFTADILPAETGYVAEGTLELRGISQPVTLPFALEIDGTTARMQGTTALDRRDYEIAPSFQDESTVGFGVDVTIDLTATQGTS
ncbi:MAG: cytochrome b/b6 domain-containing protein [Pseudomonadota bacterium]